MAILPLQPARVSNLLQASVSEQSISATQAQLLQVENELSTGQQVNVVSDNPQSAAAILGLQKALQQRTTYANNVQSASSNLGEVDTNLSNLTALLQQAQSLASASVGTDVSDTERQGNAEVVQSLITQATSIANTNFNGMYIFGGEKANQAPFVSTSNGLQFVGSNQVIQNTENTNTILATQVNGAHVFGALASRVTGATNLTPAVTAQTRITDLGGAGGQGVSLGVIQISNGTVSKPVDLSSADTLADVVAAINNAGVGGITATLGASGINLTGAAGDNITVTDSPGSSTAADLGISTAAGGAGTGVAVNGAALAPQITALTPLSALSGGAGLDPAGISITNGLNTKTITLPAGGNVGSLLNAINGANIGVTAQINATGNGINILNTIQGSALSIGENGGTTATELGIRTFSPSTALSDLNDFKGIAPAAGGDFTITRSNGSSFTVSIAGAATVQDVINDINTADGGNGVTASFATQGNGIVLTDTAGGSGTLSVASINASTAAAALGLTTTASGNTLTGADVNQSQPSGVFSDLQALVTALQTGNQTGITAAGQALQNDYNRVVNIRGQAGALVQNLQGIQGQITDENTAAQTLLSNLQDTNFTTAITQFQTLQTALQATLETTADTSQLSLLNFLQ